MRTLISLLVFSFLFASISTAQQDSFAYGQPSDLKGLKKVYVETGPDLKSHDAIIHGLAESKIEFEIVDDEKAAEIILTFTAEAVRGPIVNGDQRILQSGGGLVTATNIRGKDRVVLSFQDTRKNVFQHQPVTNFVHEFLKAYKKANGIK